MSLTNPSRTKFFSALLTVYVRILYLRLSCRLSHSSTTLSKSVFQLVRFQTLSTEGRSVLPNLSLVMEFPGNVFTNLIFENFISHEALVTGRVTANGLTTRLNREGKA